MNNISMKISNFENIPSLLSEKDRAEMLKRSEQYKTRAESSLSLAEAKKKLMTI
jgi:hypothetical protein